MSLLGNLFSSKPDYPAIDPSCTAATRIAEVKNQLGELAGQVKDPLEVVPAEHAAYVFIGKPPKRFGLAWIHDGKVSGLNTLVEEHGLKPLEVEKVVDQLRDAYERNTNVSRFCMKVQDRDVVVTPSAKLEKEVHEIRSWVIKQAIERFLEYEEWFVQEVKDGLKEVERGEIATDDEVANRFQKWGVDAR